MAMNSSGEANSTTRPWRDKRRSSNPHAPAERCPHPGARTGEHQREEQQRPERQPGAAPNSAQLEQSHQCDQRPQQKAAQVVGLPQVADRTPGHARASDDIAIRPARCKDLDTSEQSRSRRRPPGSRREGGRPTGARALRRFPSRLTDHDGRAQGGRRRTRDAKRESAQSLQQHRNRPDASAACSSRVSRQRPGLIGTWRSAHSVATARPHRPSAMHWLSSVGDGGRFSATSGGNATASVNAHADALESLID